MPCTYCPYKLLPNIYVCGHTHAILPHCHTVCISVFSWICVLSTLHLNFCYLLCPRLPILQSTRLFGCMRMTVAIVPWPGLSRYARRTMAEVVANFLPSHVNCQSIHEMRMIWLICVLRILSVCCRRSRSIPVSCLISEKPKPYDLFS